MVERERERETEGEGLGMADKRTSKQIEFHHGNGVNSWGGGISRGGAEWEASEWSLECCFFYILGFCISHSCGPLSRTLACESGVHSAALASLFAFQAYFRNRPCGPTGWTETAS